MSIAIQGEIASFHDQAAHAIITDDFNIVSCKSFADVFAALQNKSVDYAVVAIENSLYGPISEVYDLLEKHDFWIQKEHYLHIEQCLVGLPGATIDTITDLYSHPVALAQCQDFLDTTLAHAERHEHHDTAGSVEDIKKWNDPTKAAIASNFAANYYQLPVLQKSIETDHHNYTRFVLLGHKPAAGAVAQKASLLVELHSRPGALRNVLNVFADHSIDLTFLHSRPIIGKPGVYQFYIDLACKNSDTEKAIAEITTQGCSVRNLGSYDAIDTLESLMS